MSDRRQKEVDYMAAREKRVEEFEQQLQAMRIQDSEDYNQVKIKLETDVQVLYCRPCLTLVALILLTVSLSLRANLPIVYGAYVKE